MSDALAVMLNEEKARISQTKASEVIIRKIDPKAIKTRKVGSTSLSYISGATVIRLLNEAFDGQWSFEIIHEDIIESLDKYDKYKKEYAKQPPYIKILGRLTVPGFGIKEQYGTKILLGGASEQEGAAKSAATDALKKCATLLGIGLELYDEEAVDEVTTEQPPKKQSQPQGQGNQQSSNQGASGGQWDDKSISENKQEIEKLKELRLKLGIKEENFEDLNVFVQEFLNNKKATCQAIGPKNIVAFNQYLEKKIKESF